MIRKNEIRNKAATPPENKAKPATQEQPPKKTKSPALVDCTGREGTGCNFFTADSFIAVVTSARAALQFHDGRLANLVAGQVFAGNDGFRVLSGSCVALAGNLPVTAPFIAMPVSDAGIYPREDGVGFEPIYDCPVFHAAMIYVPPSALNVKIDSTLWGYFCDYSAISVVGGVVLPPAVGSGEICRPDTILSRKEGDARVVILGLKKH